MKRRGYDLRVKCTHEGCSECANYHYENRREYSEGYQRHQNYKCTRHRNPDRVLGLDNLKNEQVLTNIYNSSGSELYWSIDGKLQSGFQSGNGYIAYSKDFPEGTILKVTAEIILP